MSQSMTFADVVEAADRLSKDEQHELIRILKRRLAVAGHARVVADVKEGQAEFERGECRVATVDEIMRETLEES